MENNSITKVRNLSIFLFLILLLSLLGVLYRSDLRSDKLEKKMDKVFEKNDSLSNALFDTKQILLLDTTRLNDSIIMAESQLINLKSLHNSDSILYLKRIDSTKRLISKLKDEKLDYQNQIKKLKIELANEKSKNLISGSLAEQIDPPNIFNSNENYAANRVSQNDSDKLVDTRTAREVVNVFFEMRLSREKKSDEEFYAILDHIGYGETNLRTNDIKINGMNVEITFMFSTGTLSPGLYRANIYYKNAKINFFTKIGESIETNSLQ